MTVSTIIDQHTSSAVRSYPREAGPIVANLKSGVEAHLTQVAEALIEGGVNLGASRQQVEGLLIEAGLIERTPVTEFPSGSVEDRLTRLESGLASVTQIAESAKRRYRL